MEIERNQSEKQYKSKSYNELPDLEATLMATDYQDDLASVCRYLLKKGQATRSGRYDVNNRKKPLFSDHNRRNQDKVPDDKLVTSMDRRSGAKLLDPNDDSLLDENTLAKTMQWIVNEFPVVTELAQRACGTALDPEKHCIHIIVASNKEASESKKNHVKTNEKKEENHQIKLNYIYKNAKTYQIFLICFFILNPIVGDLDSARTIIMSLLILIFFQIICICWFSLDKSFNDETKEIIANFLSRKYIIAIWQRRFFFLIASFYSSLITRFEYFSSF